MKRFVLFKATHIMLLFLFLGLTGYAQKISKETILPPSFTNSTKTDVDHISVYPPSAELIAEEDAEDEKNGTFLKIARLMPVNTTVKNSGTWETLGNGQRIWRLRFSSEGAKASALYFDKFDIPSGASVYVYTSDKKIVDGPYFRSDNPDGNEYMIGNIVGGDITIEYVAPMTKSYDGNVYAGNTEPIINIGEYAYVYRDEGGFERGVRADVGFGSSESCEVNVNCSVGADWRIQQRGVARIYVREGFSTGYCTGTLINNTSNDGTPYFLTANHCGPNATTSNFNQWKFRFNYEASGCTNPSSESSIQYTDFTGCTKVAEGSNNGGSDFYLLRLNSFTTQDAIDIGAIYNGWDRSTTAPTGGGAGIHHPSGDIKKISFFTTTPTTASYNGGSDMTGATNAHWKVTWVNTSGKTGVTEGGSNGSPIFNSSGKVFGTLSGGASSCSASSYARYDLYGKMSFHWDNSANGSTNAKKLKPWLDPNNTGATTCDYYDPSNSGGVTPATFTYDFESCTAWAVDAFSPCETWDGDGLATYGIENVSFTNSGYTGSYIAFQNGTANGFTAHGGTKFGCCMAAENGANNDWFITPAINITNGMEFAFWARSANNTYGLEQFRVGISSDDQNFTFIDGNTTSTSTSAPVEWTLFSYDLSQYAGQTMRLAIICVSNDVVAFFIDDIVIQANQPDSTIYSSFSAEACGSYTWNDSTYTISGQYQQTFTAANSADSIVTLSLTILPIPHPTITVYDELDACNPSSVALSTEAYESYLWSNGATTMVSTTNTPGYYYVEVTDNNGCIGISEQINIGLSNAIIETPQISVVGTNSMNHNVVTWSAIVNNNVTAYRIYRENNVADVYEPMATVEASAQTYWTDETADPSLRAYRYKVTAVDDCGGESPMSDYHKTMHLTINQGIGNTWNLIWSHYEGFNFGTYRIYRGTNPSNMTMIGEVPSNLNSYTDNTAPASTGFYYQVEVVRNTRSRDAEISSRSNIVDNGYLPEYTITVMSANTNRGTVTGGGTYPEGTVITIEATAFDGFEFVSWNDNNTDNPRTIMVTADATYIASFEDASSVQTYTITVVSANSSHGTVFGGGTYAAGTVVTIAAIANNGYQFAAWNDDNTDNPRQITVTGDAVYIASFIPVTGIDESAVSEIVLFPNPVTDILNITSSEIISEIEIVNVMGQVVRRIEVNADNAVCDVEDLTSGVYVVRIRTLRQAQGAVLRKFVKE